MSVRKFERSQSRYEFIDNFDHLRLETITLLCRDFGIKHDTYTIHDIYRMCAGMPQEDYEILKDIFTRYDLVKVDIDRWPSWLIDSWRYETMALLDRIGVSIHVANSIFINNIQEYYNKRNHWDNAIGFCLALRDKLGFMVKCFVGTVNINCYVDIFKRLETEIKLIRGVRTKDNKFLKDPKYADQLPYYNNTFVFNDYDMQGNVPNYTMNNNYPPIPEQTGTVLASTLIENYNKPEPSVEPVKDPTAEIMEEFEKLRNPTPIVPIESVDPDACPFDLMEACDEARKTVFKVKKNKLA